MSPDSDVLNRELMNPRIRWKTAKVMVIIVLNLIVNHQILKNY